MYSQDKIDVALKVFRERPKVCVNHQTDVRKKYQFGGLKLWQEKMTVRKKQQCGK